MARGSQIIAIYLERLSTIVDVRLGGGRVERFAGRGLPEFGVHAHQSFDQPGAGADVHSPVGRTGGHHSGAGSVCTLRFGIHIGMIRDPIVDSPENCANLDAR